jgi:hypothetical protein
MGTDELAEILSGMYQNAEYGDRAAMVHLFGVRYANEIRHNNISITEILRATRLQNGGQMGDWCQTEINKGIKLSRYVVDREALINFINERGNIR